MLQGGELPGFEEAVVLVVSSFDSVGAATDAGAPPGVDDDPLLNLSLMESSFLPSIVEDVTPVKKRKKVNTENIFITVKGLSPGESMLWFE